jgi:hypothetical protein
MNAEHVLCTAVTCDRCCFLRISMLGLHEIPRSVRTNWYNGYQRLPKAEADLTEDFSITVRCIPYTIDNSWGRFYNKATP